MDLTAPGSGAGSLPLLLALGKWPHWVLETQEESWGEVAGRANSGLSCHLDPGRRGADRGRSGNLDRWESATF